MSIEQKLTNAIAAKGDISDHLIYLMKLSSECSSILECGVRTIVSSWAFVNGLSMNSVVDKKKLTSSDIQIPPTIHELQEACSKNNIEFEFIQGNDLDLPMKEYDMIFIDTWHVYAQLKRELAKFHPYAKKYIVMHATEVDKIDGESIRDRLNTQKQAAESGFPEYEIRCGLERAIKEFLIQHPEWKIKVRFTHNNGLTVLERVE
jgi:hypothetical protein